MSGQIGHDVAHRFQVGGVLLGDGDAHTTYGGHRVDLFYTPTADTLLLVPGGAFKRISNLKDYEQ